MDNYHKKGTALETHDTPGMCNLIFASYCTGCIYKARLQEVPTGTERLDI